MGCHFYDLLTKVCDFLLAHCLVANSCPTLCDLMDCRPRGSSVHGISQPGILEWKYISFSRGSSQSRDQARIWFPALSGGSLCTATREIAFLASRLYLLSSGLYTRMKQDARWKRPMKQEVEALSAIACKKLSHVRSLKVNSSPVQTIR